MKSGISGVDQVILLWDVASGELAGQLKGHTGTIYSLAYSREGATLASGKKPHNHTII